MSTPVEYWPFWLGALGLTAVSIAYYAVTKRQLGVSRSYDQVLRDPRSDSDSERLLSDQAAMEAALLLATQEEFGLEIPKEQPPDDESSLTLPRRPKRPPMYFSHHLSLLLGLLLGGAVSASITGELGLRWAADAQYVRHLGGSGAAWVVLFLGGLLLGFGARLGGGCTSGHALTGTSRLSRTSWVASFVLFAAGVITSHLVWGRSP